MVYEQYKRLLTMKEIYITSLISALSYKDISYDTIYQSDCVKNMDNLLNICKEIENIENEAKKQNDYLKIFALMENK
jgi:hypothetical protein